MTMLSQYLRAECVDHSEPASFYAPGCDDWVNERSIDVALMRRSSVGREYIYVTYQEDAYEDPLAVD